MEQKKIDRINQLSRKSRTPEGLTEAEKAEQAVLRREYVQSVVGNLEEQLDRTYFVEKDGSQEKLQKRGDK